MKGAAMVLLFIVVLMSSNLLIHGWKREEKRATRHLPEARASTVSLPLQDQNRQVAAGEDGQQALVRGQQQEDNAGQKDKVGQKEQEWDWEDALNKWRLNHGLLHAYQPEKVLLQLRYARMLAVAPDSLPSSYEIAPYQLQLFWSQSASRCTFPSQQEKGKEKGEETDSEDQKGEETDSEDQKGEEKEEKIRLKGNPICTPLAWGEVVPNDMVEPLPPRIFFVPERAEKLYTVVVRQDRFVVWVVINVAAGDVTTGEAVLSWQLGYPEVIGSLSVLLFPQGTERWSADRFAEDWPIDRDSYALPGGLSEPVSLHICTILSGPPQARQQQQERAEVQAAYGLVAYRPHSADPRVVAKYLQLLPQLPPPELMERLQLQVFWGLEQRPRQWGEIVDFAATKSAPTIRFQPAPGFLYALFVFDADVLGRRSSLEDNTLLLYSLINIHPVDGSDGDVNIPYRPPDLLQQQHGLHRVVFTLVRQDHYWQTYQQVNPKSLLEKAAWLGPWSDTIRTQWNPLQFPASSWLILQVRWDSEAEEYQQHLNEAKLKSLAQIQQFIEAS